MVLGGGASLARGGQLGQGVLQPGFGLGIIQGRRIAHLNAALRLGHKLPAKFQSLFLHLDFIARGDQVVISQLNRQQGRHDLKPQGLLGHLQVRAPDENHFPVGIYPEILQEMLPHVQADDGVMVIG